jgi:hypothetical protein
MAVPAFAADIATDEAPPEVSFESMRLVYAVGIATPMGFFIAFLTCMAGYASKTSPEQFKVENVIYTALISITIGFLMVYSGLAQTNAATMAITWLANGYITWYIWKFSLMAAKTLARRGIF